MVKVSEVLEYLKVCLSMFSISKETSILDYNYYKQQYPKLSFLESQKLVDNTINCLLLPLYREIQSLPYDFVEVTIIENKLLELQKLLIREVMTDNLLVDMAFITNIYYWLLSVKKRNKGNVSIQTSTSR